MSLNPAPAIAEYLRGAATATYAVASTRTFWPFATSEPTLPYVCVRLVATRRLAVGMNGASAPRDFEVEILCLASKQSAAWTLADAVLTDLDNHTGVTPAGGPLTFRRCYCSNAVDLISEANFEAGVFAVQLIFAVTI